MGLLRIVVLSTMLLVLLACGTLAMPINPVLAEKAGGIYALSEEVLAPPPAYVDVPLPIPASGHTGSYKACLILIKFSDLPNTYTRASFDSMAFTGWATGTISQYYNEISYGNLTLSGDVGGWFSAGQTRNYYGNGAKGWGAYPQNTAKLVEEAVDAAEMTGANFARYDNDGDGIAESIFIVHSGEGCETSLNPNDIQSHVSSITAMGGTARFYDGVTIDTYACCPELQASSPVAHINIGAYCHEYGHILGLPDLYDVGRWCTSYSSWGVGAWSLMSFGGWGGDVMSPQSPVHMCPWCKIQMGWLTPTVMSGVSGQTVTLSGFESTPQVLKLGMDSPETEYFLVAFYDSLIGFDKSLKKKGLVVFHVDDNMWTQDDCEDGGTCTSGGSHYQVAVEQPDGAFNLDCGTAYNYADRGDAYPYQAVNYFDGTTTPKSNNYRGGPSGVALTNIGWANGPRTQMNVTVNSGELYQEVAYDDGGRDICYAWGAANSGFAVRITPTTYPSFVRGLEIVSCDPYYPQFQCRLWDASGTGGTPGSPLSQVRTSTGAVVYNWSYVDFTADSVLVSSGDFWAVYIEYNNSDLASDNSSAWSGRTMMYYGGNFYVDNGAYGNYMIRAVLDTTTCAGVEPVFPIDVTAWAAPNPFSDAATINFLLSGPSAVSLAIYDVTGRLVRDMGTREFGVGSHSIVWEGSDSSGSRVGAGIYFYRFTVGEISRTGKLSLLR
jgi:M6 family metalloprotease-like protein